MFLLARWQRSRSHEKSWTVPFEVFFFGNFQLKKITTRQLTRRRGFSGLIAYANDIFNHFWIEEVSSRGLWRVCPGFDEAFVEWLDESKRFSGKPSHCSGDCSRILVKNVAFEKSFAMIRTLNVWFAVKMLFKQVNQKWASRKLTFETSNSMQARLHLPHGVTSNTQSNPLQIKPAQLFLHVYGIETKRSSVLVFNFQVAVPDESEWNNILTLLFKVFFFDRKAEKQKTNESVNKHWPRSVNEALFLHARTAITVLITFFHFSPLSLRALNGVEKSFKNLIISLEQIETKNIAPGRVE